MIKNYLVLLTMFPKSAIRNPKLRAAIRNLKSEFRNQLQEGFLFSRKAAIPSCPSSDALISAIILAV
jgi:hypothetical protein